MTARTSPAAQRDADPGINHRTAADPGAQHSDAEVDGTFYAISDLESIVKAVIRQAPDKAHRWLMWEAFTAAIEAAAEYSQEMPWDPPEAVTRVSARLASRALIRMLEAIPDIAERDRLAKVGEREAEKVEQRLESGISDASPSPGYSLRCQYCGNPIPAARGKKARYCKNSHRVNAHRRAKREAERIANAMAPAAR